MARLLIIDDEESLCRVLKLAFRKKGHLVETASSGKAAKKKIDSRVFDLIISDIRMPDLTGIDLLEYAHKTHKPAPFILMTAVPTMSTAIQAVNLGAYAPSETEYWNQGHSTERDFIYVTTQTLTREQLQKLSEDVGDKRSLLVCCSAFRAKDLSQFPNLTVKKIPKMVLHRCEWGHDDYSLEIENLPAPLERAVEPEPERSSGKKSKASASLSLFDSIVENTGGGQ